MNQVYLICAVLGATVVTCQFLLGLVGLGGHHDFGGHGVDFESGAGGADHDFGGHDAESHAAGHDSVFPHESAMSWFVGVLSFRTVIAGMTFFGLTGLAADAQGAHPGGTLALAVGAGVTALYAVAWTMRFLSRLRADGTARIHNAIGETAVVYLTIPGRRSGKGKVTVTVQNRTMEYEALTDDADLPTGASVRILDVVDSETLAVASAPEPVRSNND